MTAVLHLGLSSAGPAAAEKILGGGARAVVLHTPYRMLAGESYPIRNPDL
jgi:hypothetical protein